MCRAKWNDVNGRGALNERRGVGERKTTSSQSETEKGQDTTEKEVPRHHHQAFWSVARVRFHAVGWLLPNDQLPSLSARLQCLGSVTLLNIKAFLALPLALLAVSSPKRRKPQRNNEV